MGLLKTTKNGCTVEVIGPVPVTKYRIILPSGSAREKEIPDSEDASAWTERYSKFAQDLYPEDFK